MKRIHVVGVSPRTGTTLMTEALKTCFEIDYYTPHEDELVKRAPGHPDIYLTKFPHDIMRVGPSLRVDPDLYVICMIRDPRDIICSRHKFDPDKYWAGLKYWNTYTPVLDKLEGQPRFISVKYEDFVREPDHIQRLIAARIPFLKQIIAFSQYHERASVSERSKRALRRVRPISPESVGRWKNHKARIAGQIKRHGPITQDLIKFGYEEDSDWLGELKDVEPDLRPSYHAEYMDDKTLREIKRYKYLEAARRAVEQALGRRLLIKHPRKWPRLLISRFHAD